MNPSEGQNQMLSIILPCYNEYENIKEILESFNNLLAENKESLTYRKDIEVIIVDNGSTDESKSLLKDIEVKYNFCRSIRIEENKGYGHGIKEGVQISKGEIIGWTHADLQADPLDVLKAFDLMKSEKNLTPIFVKGLRNSRPIKDEVFTKGMSVFESLLFLTPMRDINAQPNIMHREFYNLCQNPPDDFSFDLYYYILAKKNKCLIKRFPVFFKPRKYGVSKWNIDWKAKAKFIRRTILFSFKLRSTLIKDNLSILRKYIKI